jgi:hypothetical protein
MKKLLCFLLAFTMITSLAIIGVNAEETERFSTYTSKFNQLIYVDAENGRKYEYLTTGINDEGSEFLLMNWYGDVNNEVYYQTLGDYVLLNPHTVGEKKGPYFIIKDNEIYGVAEGYEKGVITDKELYDTIQKTIYSKRLLPVGDTNRDGVISVIDATFIQSKLVSDRYYYRYYENSVSLLADYNRDGIVNVLDATAIQKAIVNL